ncbi:MAG: Ras family protein [Promethearchaeota archaeon CR_4]|nr:MAG: Ras family protein [Candidatus Lokiarchaeota archaeon CR_4]
MSTDSVSLKLVFKVVIIGDSGVGKTTLIKRFTQNTFQGDYISTFGAQFSIYHEIVEGDDCKLFFWDLAGQSEFAAFRSKFYQDSNAGIIVYSLENNNFGRTSFQNVPRWHDEVRKQCGDIPIILFANKTDLIDEKQIAQSAIEKLLLKHHFLGASNTSAKTGKGVQEGFQAIIRLLHKNKKTQLQKT